MLKYCLCDRNEGLPLANLLEPTELSCDHTNVFSEVPNATSSSSLHQPEVKRRRVGCDYEVDRAILKCLKNLDDKKTRVLDEEELFGMHIAAILRRLNSKQKAMARLKIHQVLTDIELPEVHE